MFRKDTWASAFMVVMGENAENAFDCMAALVPPIKAVQGALIGRSASLRLERIMRESLGAASKSAVSGSSGGAGKDPVEYAIRFIALLVEKKCFKHVDLILAEIEERLDGQKGIYTAVLESALPLDSGFEEELRSRIAKRTGAAGIKMKTSLAPDLLGGYRLWIKGFCVDASLSGQLKKMTADLEAAVLAAPGEKM